jgi:hypothetical protein
MVRQQTSHGQTELLLTSAMIIEGDISERGLGHTFGPSMQPEEDKLKSVHIRHKNLKKLPGKEYN